MPLRLFRQILTALIVTAYLGASVFTSAPGAFAAADMPAGMTMGSDQGDHGMPMPCGKSMKLGCITEAGCIFMVSLTPHHPGLVSRIGWSIVTYTADAEFLQGHSIKPPLDPPISRT